MEEVLVLSGVRTPIGKYGGALASVPPCDLAAQMVREAVNEAVKRSGADPVDVGHVVFGNVLHTELRDMYLSRVAAVNGGLEVGTPALTLNRLCGSGMYRRPVRAGHDVHRRRPGHRGHLRAGLMPN